MAKGDKEKPVPIRCYCGAEPVWTKAKLGFFYSCPNCLIRGGWMKTADKAIEVWNTEVLQVRNKNRRAEDA
jgi:hypothetical protein